MQKIVDALRPIRPYLRGVPPGLPFELDLRTLRNGLNFTFTTSGLSTKTPEPLSQLGRSNIFYPAGAV